MNHAIFSWFQLSLGFLGALALFLILVTLVIALFLRKKKNPHEVKIEIKNINHQFTENKNKILQEVLNHAEQKQILKEKKKLKKEEKKKSPSVQEAKRIYVLDFHGDIGATAVHAFREQVTALLQAVRPADEVVVRLESAGGLVHAYGLAASQLARFCEQHIPLTVCVDKVAASGGYMMACLACKIIAAPFSVIGSIGVIASVPNLNRVLKKNDVDFLEMTAGEYKRTLTMLGEVTEKGKLKFQAQLEETHSLFKDHVKKFRPIVNLDLVATGEYWLGTKALELNLVDELKTSDAYLLEASKVSSIYHIFSPKKENLREKLSGALESLFHHFTENLSHIRL